MFLRSERRQVRTWSAVVLLAVIAGSGCGAAASSQPAATPDAATRADMSTGTVPLPDITDSYQPPAPSAGETISVAIADFEIYADLESIVRASSVVVSGTAGSAVPLPASDADIGSAGRYEVSFQIDGVVRGDSELGPDTTVRLVQEGGLGSDGVTRKVDGSPIYEVGQRYLLFLRYSESTGRYVAVGGEQGVFACDADGVLTARAMSSAGGVTGQLTGKTLDDVTDLVRAIA